MDWGIRRLIVIGFTLSAVLIFFVGAWGSSAKLAGAVIATGQIEPQHHSLPVEHRDGGVVSSLLVREGDRVKRDEVLLVLDGSEIKSEINVLEVRLAELRSGAEQFKAEQMDQTELIFPPELEKMGKSDKNLRDFCRRQRQLFETRLRTHEGTIKGLQEQQGQKRSEIKGLEAQARASGSQLALTTDELQKARTLRGKGLLEASRLLELERSGKALESQIAGFISSIAVAEGDIARLEVEIERARAERREQASASLQEAEGQIIELEEQRQGRQNRVNRLAVRAPQDGVVHDLQVHARGAVIKPGETILTVVPSDDPPGVTVHVDTRHIDSVHLGQTAMVRLTSFDTRLTPEIRAAVVSISADILRDTQTRVPYYAVELSFDDVGLRNLGANRLLPGMPVEVFIQTGERSPLEYALKPFLDYVRRAFRE